MSSFQIGYKIRGQNPEKGLFYSKLQIVAKTPNIEIINLNFLRWSPKFSGRKKDDRGTQRPSIVRCGQQLLAFHHLASTSSFSYHASLLLLGLSYRWSGYSHIENLFCSQEQWDAGCDLKFGNLKREACREKTVWSSCRKKSKVKIMKILGKNMMLRRHTGLSSVYKFSQHFWFMCIRSGLFGWLHLCREFRIW